MKGGDVVPNSPVNAFSSAGAAIGTNKCVSMQVLLADKTSGGSKGNQMLWMISSDGTISYCVFTTLLFP